MLLRRQMDAIRKELGEGDDDASREYRAKLAELELPDAVRAAVDKELDRLERMGAAEPRAGVGPQLARRGARPAVGRRTPTSTTTSARRAKCSTPITKASTT